MTATLFEVRDRDGGVWRLEVVHYNGRTFANLRKWWRDADGVLRPTRQGVTFPPERIPELGAACAAWSGANALSGPENGS